MQTHLLKMLEGEQEYKNKLLKKERKDLHGFNFVWTHLDRRRSNVCWISNVCGKKGKSQHDEITTTH